MLGKGGQHGQRVLGPLVHLLLLLLLLLFLLRGGDFTHILTDLLHHPLQGPGVGVHPDHQKLHDQPQRVPLPRQRQTLLPNLTPRHLGQLGQERGGELVVFRVHGRADLRDRGDVLLLEQDLAHRRRGLRDVLALVGPRNIRKDGLLRLLRHAPELLVQGGVPLNAGVELGQLALRGPGRVRVRRPELSPPPGEVGARLKPRAGILKGGKVGPDPVRCVLRAPLGLPLGLLPLQAEAFALALLRLPPLPLLPRRRAGVWVLPRRLLLLWSSVPGAAP